MNENSDFALYKIVSFFIYFLCLSHQRMRIKMLSTARSLCICRVGLSAPSRMYNKKQTLFSCFSRFSIESRHYIIQTMGKVCNIGEEKWETVREIELERNFRGCKRAIKSRTKEKSKKLI